MSRKRTGQPNGRPPMYKTPEELQDKIDEYFGSCWQTNSDSIKIQTIPYTMTGLAIACGMSRRALLDYTKKDAFLPTLKKAKAICQRYAEEYLFKGKNQAGAIFNLKNNYAWKDKTEHAITGPEGGPVGLLLEEIDGKTSKIR